MGVESMIHTAYDVMKEFLITNADLDGKYGIPKIPKTFIHPGKDTVDFAESFSRKIKNHRELDVNFYVDDVQFQSARQVYGAFKMFSCSHYARFQHIGWQEWNATGNVLVEQIPQSCTGSLHDLE